MKSTLLLVLLLSTCQAAEPWRMPSSHWTDADAERILDASPWAKRIDRGLTVRWESASIIRAALQKLHHRLPLFEDPCYALSLTGLKPPAATTTAPATLRAAGRQPVKPFKVHIQEGQVLFLFPRAEALAQPIVFRLPAGLQFGDDVEFDAQIGGMAVRQKFSLRSMSYMGRPEL
jgi:hypothetical protein